MNRTITASTLALVVATGCGTPAERFRDPGPTGGIIGTSTTGGFEVGATTTTVGGGSFVTYDKPVIVASRPPPPISGGTLIVIAKGKKAAVADPDRDQVSIVDLDKIVVTATIALQKGDEPGRLVEDADGLVHVALRGTGELVTLDPAAGTVLARKSVCTHPRGVAYDGATNQLHIACVGGELVTLNATGGAVVRQIQLERDLRDVVVDGSRLLVSRFRAAELLVVEQDGHVSSKLQPPPVKSTSFMGEPISFAPAVAWRTIPAQGGGAIMAFQEEQTSDVHIAPGGYGGFGCGGIVRSALSLLRANGDNGWTIGNIPNAVLAVDVAMSPDGTRLQLASAGATRGANQFGLQTTTPVAPPTGSSLPPDEACGRPLPGPGSPTPDLDGQAIAVAFDTSNRLLVQTREPMLVVGDRAVLLTGSIIEDSGHELFHMATPGGLACASCHPEGREDGHVWNFDKLGQRRTQSIGGALSGTEPFHWGGDMKDFPTLTHEVMTGRMSGPSLRDGHIQALANWIDAVPPWKAATPVDPAAIDRGRALFASDAAGCASCHSGAKLTNNLTVDVGTGAAFQVPSLIGLSYRAPFLHHGCANTIDDRFGSCGGGDKHGKTSALSTSQRADLVSYLGSL